ncbi:uncharacterized protein BJ212DRAFT_1410888 [Suillus subaureus]|uniref:Uncharacterized protein n=1 Tax=Suillus subaureus TaxID=48587 RepID=A0A9P7AT83_9AGAM|nr:uncharacterized protein BJ212DRAFT_1410888 [Suillus subaureus]KAG1795275.1 hypothetical protein BJ212DRAFT_1410888 [Suillus subaureus]
MSPKLSFSLHLNSIPTPVFSYHSFRATQPIPNSPCHCSQYTRLQFMSGSGDPKIRWK